MMRFTAMVIGAATLLAACSEPQGAEDTAAADAPGRVAGAPPVPPTVPQPPADPEAVQVSESSNLYSFDFSYPKEAAAIPELKARFDGQMEAAKSKLMAMAREGRKQTKENGFPYNAYAEGTTWKVVADLPRYLSLSAGLYSYTGGAHPNSGTAAMVWDKETKRALTPLDMFASPDALTKAIRAPYCEALNAKRAERRGDVAEAGAGAEEDGSYFAECPKAEELTVLLGSSNGKTFDLMTLIADPYVAGPYAEGGYEVNVPVTGEVMRALRPAFRSAFSIR